MADIELIAFKFALIGANGVGKSMILNRFIKNKFNTKYVETLGSNYL